MEQGKKPYVLVFGAAICDIIGFTNGPYRACDSNPGAIKVSFGGVCRNIAENMALIGTNTKLISVIGDDIRGNEMLHHAENIDLDMTDSFIIKGQTTPTYLAVLNELGEMVSAVVDMKILDYLTTDFIDSKEEVMADSEYLVIGADTPEIVEYIVQKHHKQTKLVLDPVSACKVAEIKNLIPYFHTIKPNRHEAEVLCGFMLKTQEDVRRAGRYFYELGVKNIFISLDADGVYYFNGEEEGIVKAKKANVVNVTGAGDAFLAGIGHGYMNHLSLIDTVKFAAAMSIITIAHEETIHPEMSYKFVQKYVEELEWEETVF